MSGTISVYKILNLWKRSISTKLKFCEKEPSEVEKIEKTLSIMLAAQMILQQQYRKRGFTVYSKLIKTLLQAKKHGEVLMWNSNLHPVVTKPLPEVHANTENKQHSEQIAKEYH